MFRQQADQTADIQTRFCFLVTFPRGSPGQYANGTRRKTVSYPFLQFESTTVAVNGCTSRLAYCEGQSKTKITIDWAVKTDSLSWEVDPVTVIGTTMPWARTMKARSGTVNFSLSHYFLFFVPRTGCKLVLTLAHGESPSQTSSSQRGLEVAALQAPVTRSREQQSAERLPPFAQRRRLSVTS